MDKTRVLFPGTYNRSINQFVQLDLSRLAVGSRKDGRNTMHTPSFWLQITNVWLYMHSNKHSSEHMICFDNEFICYFLVSGIFSFRTMPSKLRLILFNLGFRSLNRPALIV